jgi:hypothetical protein
MGAREQAIEALSAMIYGEDWRQSAPWGPAAVAPMVDAVGPLFQASLIDAIETAGCGICGKSERTIRAEERERLRAQVMQWRDYAEANERTGYMRDEHRVGQVYAYERVLELLEGEDRG